ncbi:RNA-directed DNA polymerase, eukaryota, reverse transcriptase zinc-binding domain protein, partial [Tanacetum coccineum]
MSIDNNKPPDPIVEEFRILTKMTSSDDVRLVSPSVIRAKAGRGKLHKPRRGNTIKVSTPSSSSAGAGSMLKKLRSAKILGKARDRAESFPSDIRGGKKVIHSAENDVIRKVLSDVRAGSINSFKFDMGSSDDCNVSVSLNKDNDNFGLSSTIDGSFIKEPLFPLNDPFLNSGSPVALGSNPMDSAEKDCTGDVGNARPVQSVPLVSTSSAMTGVEFEFGKVDSSKGILKKPIGPLLNVQLGSNIPNPFVKSSGGYNSNENWNSKEGNGFGAKIMSNQYSAVADSFAEKLKQGAEEMALKMEYLPNAVSKLDNGSRRIHFSAEEVLKGGAECSLQLYGYFVGTSMDYRVVRGNLMKMWRKFGIVDITKTNSGIFYFKFSNEEGMKNVLDSGPWMIQNIPLVLNIWEPGIWLDKAEPASIPIWVCVYNIPMELCKMDKMTKERCLKKAGKLDFARVLVEISAVDDLPSVLEIAYPPIGNSPAKIGKLDVKYQWKPPLCTHCKTF